jgi:large subunit ribosomal protein L2
MGIRHYKPTSNGSRHRQVSDFADLKGDQTVVSSLLEPKKKTGGRNVYGRITSRHIGGGADQKLRKIDFKRDKIGVPAVVKGIQYDPNRSARIALLAYADGEKRYILAPDGLNVGDSVVSSAKADIRPGNSMPLSAIPDGTIVHNIEFKRGKGGQIARSAGTYAQVMAKEKKHALLRMPSGELRKVSVLNRATIGQVGNLEHDAIDIGKAGLSRHRGIRPSVRGVAMNPIDHPMGGGEGRTSGGRHPCTPWGFPTKGKKTRRNKRTDSMIVKRRK